MAQAAVKELFDFKAEDIFSVIMDFEKYPDFLPEVSDCKIVAEGDDYKDVEMTVNFIKTAKYTIRVFNDENKKVWWELLDGDLFKKNNGIWTLDSIGSQTQVEYSLDVDFKIFVPGMIAKKAVAVSLPAMVKNFKKRVGSV
ncbi:MAG: type II toxin-antitoxin system RatA family toxin [Bdellovibrionales bacterium]